MKLVRERAIALRTSVRGQVSAQFPTLARVKQIPEPVDRSAIALGRNPAGRAVLLPQRARAGHMHVVGTTGGGKSHFIGHCLRQDIADGAGALLVDLHGEHPDSLYRSTLAWLDHKGYLAKRTVHLIDLNAPTHTVGFNPLTRPDTETDLSVIAGVTLEAFSHAWGGEDTTQKPTIERVLTAAFAALAELNLTLVEAPLLLDRNDRSGLRACAVESLRDRYARDELRRLHELSLDDRRRHDFDLEVLGPLNRLARFVRPTALRAMLGQTEGVLDFCEAMDEGHVILVNLSGGRRVFEKDAELLGRLITRFLFFHSKRRRAPQRPFFVYLDECHRYLSGDLENILAESRKYGVWAILAHQWLEQLRVQSDNMLAAVRNATNVKVVFRIKDNAEAEDLAASVIPLDLEMPVAPLIKPTVIGHRRIRLQSESTSEQSATTRATSDTHGESYSHTISHAESYGTTDSESIAISETEAFSGTQSHAHSELSGISEGTVAADMLDPNLTFFGSPLLVGMSRGSSQGTTASVSSGSTSSTGRTTGSGRTKGTARAVSHSTTEGESFSHGTHHATSVGNSETEGTGATVGSAEALEPIMELRPSAVHGKEAVLYMAAQTLRNLRTGCAFVSYVGAAGMVSTLLSVPRISSHPLSPEAFAGLRERVLSASHATVPLDVAVATIAKRQQDLLDATAPHDDEPVVFRTKAPPTAG